MELTDEHTHVHGEESKRSQFAKLLITIVLLTGAYFLEKTHAELSAWQLLLAYLPAYLLIGHDTLTEAWEGMRRGEFYNEDFLMSVATIGALCIGFLPGAETEYPEAVFVMLFFQIGELFEEYAEGKSRQSISHLMDMRPETATVERDGKEITLAPEEVRVGEIIIVRPGERIAIDGCIIEGTSTLDTMALTGESMPRNVNKGDEVLSGCINLSGALRISTTKKFKDSTVTKIMELVESATEQKSKSESFITKFARIYTPIVVWGAILLAFVPPFFMEQPYDEGLGLWLHRALIFLIVSCPCALVISVPLTFFAGIGCASRCGILVKGSNYMDTLSKLDTIVFDKTGTLTKGQFSVQEIHPTEKVAPERLIRLAALAEKFSTHPIGQALRKAYTEVPTDEAAVKDVEEIAGRGIKACIDGNTVYVGNDKLMTDRGVDHPHEQFDGTVVHVATETEYVGYIVIADSLKDDSKEAVGVLKNMGIHHTVMLTGDGETVANNVARTLCLDSYRSELLPTDKVNEVEKLLKKCPTGRTLAFVGDGINDAPVLKRADVGIAMGAMGSDAAIEAADVVVMDDKPSKVAEAIYIARRTIAIAHQNIILAIGIKVAVLILATVGLGNMALAVFADVGVTVLAVLNAMRALRR